MYCNVVIHAVAKGDVSCKLSVIVARLGVDNDSKLLDAACWRKTDLTLVGRGLSSIDQESTPNILLS